MSPVVEIVDSTPEHVQRAGRNLREADAREATALGLEPHKILWRSYRTSILRRTILVDSEVAAMFGVSGVLFGLTGQPWLVTTPASERVSPLVFARIYRAEVKKMFAMFPTLENYVDSSYGTAIRLLRMNGFRVSAPETLGPKKALFCKFAGQA